MFDYILQSATIRANQLCARFPALRSQRDDIRQEIVCHVLRKMDRYDQSQGGRRTFISRVSANAAMSYARASRRPEAVPEEAVQKNGMSDVEMRDAIAQMPRETQKIANLLAAGYTIREIVEKTGESVGRIYRVHMPTMRRVMGDFRKG